MMAASSESGTVRGCMSEVLEGEVEELGRAVHAHEVVGRELVDRACVQLGRGIREGEIAGGVELAGVVEVKEAARELMAGAVRQVLVVRDHVDDEAELVRERVAGGLEALHHAVAAVDVEADAQLFRREVRQRAYAGVLEQVVDSL